MAAAHAVDGPAVGAVVPGNKAEPVKDAAGSVFGVMASVMG